MTLGHMNFRGPIMGPVGFRGPSGGPMGFRGPIEMTLRNQYVEDRRPFFGGRLKNIFFIEDIFFKWRPFFWRSHQNPEKTVLFSPSVLEFTKLEMPNIWADPRPTFGSRRPWCLVLASNHSPCLGLYFRVQTCTCQPGDNSGSACFSKHQFYLFNFCCVKKLQIDN